MDGGDPLADGVRLTGAGDTRITSVETWRAHAAPKGGDVQWVEGRSAKELAKAWCVRADGTAR